tara:strand:- start:3457 stop:3771 length:315 start_codon:yes stop_codon:yes gene_type:complete
MQNTKFQMWLDEVNQQRKEYWDKNYSYKEYTPLTVKKGIKYMKLIDETTVWAFVSMWEGVFQGTLVCKGDLLKPASWNTPAKHSRGNIFDGSAKWSYYGPEYLK